MHLWPSVRIRASFKHAHLRHLDWNRRRMRFFQSQEAAATAAEGGDGCDGGEQGCEPLLSSKGDTDVRGCSFVDLLRDILVLLSCCCCCFCCGACRDEDEK